MNTATDAKEILKYYSRLPKARPYKVISSFRVFDPTPCRFPKPRLPLLPMPAASSFGLKPASTYLFAGHGRPSAFFSRGRYALREAFARTGVGKAGSLLAPAYHCRTMIDPAVSLGAETILYPLTPTLAPDWNALAGLVQAAECRPAALLLTHYFGFPQDVAAAAAFCKQHGIALIEDCSHAFINHRDAPQPGTLSHYVVASPYKFVPSDDGGLLFGEAAATVSLRPPGFFQEAKAFARIVERILARPGAPSAPTPSAQETLAAGPCGTEHHDPGNTLSTLYDPDQEGRAGHRASQLLIHFADADRIAEARRANYRRWLEAVNGLPNCAPLFPSLPEGCVPYMFPLRIDAPNPHFHVLKHQGIPIWRWDEMAESDCKVSRDYRDHLLHLPCHQSLSAADMAWMTATVCRVIQDCGTPPCR